MVNSPIANIRCEEILYILAKKNKLDLRKILETGIRNELKIGSIDPLTILNNEKDMKIKDIENLKKEIESINNKIIEVNEKYKKIGDLKKHPLFIKSIEIIKRNPKYKKGRLNLINNTFGINLSIIQFDELLRGCQ